MVEQPTWFVSPPTLPQTPERDDDASSTSLESEASQADLSIFFRSALLATGPTDGESASSLGLVVATGAEAGFLDGGDKGENEARGGKEIWRAMRETERGSEHWFDQEEIRVGITNKWVINPLGAFRSFWNAYLVFLLLYVSIVSPYYFAFLGLGGRSFFFYAERLVDATYVVEIVLMFFTAYERVNPYGWETSLSKIRRRYLCTWFCADVLATIPWDMIRTDKSPSFLQIFRFIRVLRVLKLVDLLRSMRMKQWFTLIEVKVNLRYGVFRMIKLAVVVLLVAHWTGCIFYFLGAVETVNGTPSWLGDEGLPTSNRGLYIAALYFSMKTISSVGYGDITPVSTLERIYVIILMFIGAGIFGFIIGELGNIILTLQESTARHRNQMDQALALGQSRGLPDKLTFRMRRHLMHRRHGHAVDDTVESELIGLMGSDLRRQILEHTYRRYLEKSVILQGVPWDDIYCHMSNQLARPSEVIFSPGDVVVGFFGVVSGQVLMHTDGVNGPEEEGFNAGDIFGEKEILFNRKRSSTAISVGYSELVLVPKGAVLAELRRGDGSALEVVEEEEVQLLWERILTRAAVEVRACEIAREMRNAARRRRQRLGVDRANRSGDGGWTDSGFALVSEEPEPVQDYANGDSMKLNGIYGRLERAGSSTLLAFRSSGSLGAMGVNISAVSSLHRDELERAFVEQREELARLREATAALRDL